MSKALKEFGNVARHAEGDGLGDTVSVNGEANVFLGGHVDFDDVTGVLKGGDKVVGVGLSFIFTTKIIDYKGEGCFSNGVDEEAGNCGTLNVSGGSEMRDEFSLSEKASLFEAVHSFVDFVEDETVMSILVEVIFCHTVCGDEFDIYTEVFRSV